MRPLALLKATKNSTSVWQDDLQALFHRSKDRFPGVVWDLVDEVRRSGVIKLLCTRAHRRASRLATSPSVPLPSRPRYPSPLPRRHLSPRPPPPHCPSTSASTSPTPPPSARFGPPAPSVIGSLTCIPFVHKPALFADELEYLHTGKGLDEAFIFLFDAYEQAAEGDADADETRIDKLRKDLVFMWRSRLYSDVKIELTGEVQSASGLSEEETAAIFWSHRFILMTRSPYFHDQLITYGLKSTPALGEPARVRLPSPPFTPPAMHFTLGYLYLGTVNFSNRSYDLNTAFAILCSANYLQLQSLQDEVQARLVQEMLDGLFHAFLEFAEYERITGGRWGSGGCHCRPSARRAPRVLLFSVRLDVQNAYLECGARRTLVGLFGEGWCTAEFSMLSQKTKDRLVCGLVKHTTPVNVFSLLFAAQAALRDVWAVPFAIWSRRRTRGD
ncbi:hypothetical protein DFH11DRAFT_1773759 [Phellopilus nigrolimitatus]|nr:hypothetical protein DFH11DRAFT_1773759 [Phellopilus nigrolimitatus]